MVYPNLVYILGRLGFVVLDSYIQYSIYRIPCQIKCKKNPPSKRTKGQNLNEEGLEEEIDVGRDSCIPSSFRREQQFYDYLLPTTIRLGACPTSDICPLALHHRELHTLTRSRQVNSVTHRKDYKPFQNELRLTRIGF